MNRIIRSFIFTVTLLASSLSFADTGLVSCKTKVTFNDGTQENFRTYVNVKKKSNWDGSGFHFAGNRMNKFPSDSSSALFAMAHVQNDKLRIVYMGMNQLRDTSWAGGSEYVFNFKLNSNGKTIELLDSSATSDHISVKIESCVATISNS